MQMPNVVDSPEAVVAHGTVESAVKEALGDIVHSTGAECQLRGFRLL